jgi:hypothetical protein
MKLTENLSLAEVTYSATALRKGIANEPTVSHLNQFEGSSQQYLSALPRTFWKAFKSYLWLSVKGVE